MDSREPKQTPEPTYAEQPKAKEASINLIAQDDHAMTAAVASMAMAMAGLMGPAEEAALNDAAAKLMEGGEDGDA